MFDRVVVTDRRRVTDSDGRCMQLWLDGETEEVRRERGKLKAGKLYKVIFHTKPYFEASGRKCFYPWVDVRALANIPLRYLPRPADHLRGPECE